MFNSLVIYKYKTQLFTLCIAVFVFTMAALDLFPLKSPPSKTRLFGKGRKKKEKIRTKKFLRQNFSKNTEITFPGRSNRTWHQKARGGLNPPSNKRPVNNRRRQRRKVRTYADDELLELLAEKETKKQEVAKMVKMYQTKIRQMRKRFLRDIQALMKQQKEDLVMLKKSV
ncbi:MAG: hypothetical protein CMD74_02575 [Gammaproteobacteria bacterium]|nr:hypothetical protein [Gammaproteobacteria bacterium]